MNADIRVGLAGALRLEVIPNEIVHMSGREKKRDDPDIKHGVDVGGRRYYVSGTP
jgi:hypothetical protein